MHDDEVEKNFINTRRGVTVTATLDRGSPGGGLDASSDGGREAVGVGLGVGFEEACIDLREEVTDSCCFVGEGDGEGGFEEGD